jgi:error-prone DNA polymerase
MVANVITFRTRGAMRASGLALGIPEHLLAQSARLLDSRAFRSEGIEGTVGYLEREHGQGELKDIPWALWANLAARLHGFPRHLGIHSGGFVIADAPLDLLIPQEPATMEGRTVIQWSKEDIEALGFFKIDILALGMLTAVRKCFALIEAHHDETWTLATLPQDDQPTYEMIQRADTVGTFQIESRAQMSMLPRLKPKNYYDLVIEVAIIRPGPIQGGMIHPYLKRRDGLEPVTYPDPRLEPILKRTLGIPIFQEQVMRIAMAVGGFTGGEADELRRNMGTWGFVGDLQPLQKKLAAGMLKNGLAPEFVDALIKQLGGFAHYGFPESHSASFALIAYASSYLKKHYPAAFFAALLNSQPMGFYTPHVLIQAAKQDGVELRPVSAEFSDWDCTLESVTPSAQSARRGTALRLGMRLVRSLSQNGAEQLMRVRQRLGGFGSYERLLQHAKLNRDDLTALAAANALHPYGLERRAALWQAEASPFTPMLEDVETQPLWETMSEFDVIQQDFAATGTTLGRHPVQLIREGFWCFKPSVSKLTLAAGIKHHPTETEIVVFGMVIVRQSPPTAKGMVFLTLEDETGFFNLVFHPPVFQRFHKLIDHRAFLCVTGRLQGQADLRSILVKHVHPPLPQAATVTTMPKPRDERTGDDPRTKLPEIPAGNELVPSRNYM